MRARGAGGRVGGAVGVRDEDMISMVSTESIVLESVKRATKEEEASGKMDAKPADGMEGLAGSNARATPA